MKIIADENMPLVAELFSPFGEVRLMPGRGMRAEDVADADVLLVRSVTKVGRELLEGSAVKFVGSATIGTDHVDLSYLYRRGTTFFNAPGCNANAVVNYVLCALSSVNAQWPGKSVAIIGCGNVGGRLYRMLKTLGVDCRCYDPFLGSAQQADLCSFEEACEAEILCLHTPFTTDGPFPTSHMFDKDVLDALSAGTLLLNAGRGGVVDNRALKERLRTRHLHAVLDVWESEPHIDRELVQMVDVGTPHIAGYSLEGRIRGSTMVYERFCEWLGATAEDFDVSVLADQLDQPAGDVKRIIDLRAGQDLIAESLKLYDPRADCRDLLAGLKDKGDFGAYFDSLRKSYPLRREFSLRNL